MKKNIYLRLELLILEWLKLLPNMKIDQENHGRFWAVYINIRNTERMMYDYKRGRT